MTLAMKSLLGYLGHEHTLASKLKQGDQLYSRCGNSRLNRCSRGENSINKQTTDEEQEENEEDDEEESAGVERREIIVKKCG